MRTAIVLFVSAMLSASLSAVVYADDAADVIAVTKAQWAAEMKNDTKSMLSTIADDYTEFNPDVPTRLEGKALLQRLVEASLQGGDKTIAAEMINEKVQVYGSVAILSYNYVGSVKAVNGTVKPVLAKSTRIYHKRDGGWMLVHANFAPITAPSD